MGNAKIIPDVPHNMEKAIIESIDTKALILTFEPVMCGVIKLPSINCINPKIPITPTAYQAESFVAKATIAGKSEPIMIPI